MFVIPFTIFIFLTKYYIKQTKLGYWKVVSMPFKAMCVINCLITETTLLFYLGRSNAGSPFWLTLLMMIFLIPTSLLSTVIYFFPYLRAYEKDSLSITKIFVYNLLFGWTFIGWILLIFISNRYIAADSGTSSYDAEVDDKIIELNRKFEQGLLTEYEFTREKNELESLKSNG